MYKLLTAFAFVLTLSVNSIFAQTDVETTKVPKNIMEAFKAKYPNDENEKWTKDGKNNYTVVFKINKKKCRSTYSKDAKWQGASIALAFDELPDAVKDAFKKTEYAAWKIQDVMKSESELETIFTITAKDKKEQKFLTFLPDGKLK